MLVMEHQHGVAVDRFPDRANCRRVERTAEVNAADLPDKNRVDLPNYNAHACTSGAEDARRDESAQVSPMPSKRSGRNPESALSN
jgi:hypothetical protein